MRPLRPLQTLSLSLIIGAGLATGSLAQGYSLGAPVDDGPLAQPPIPVAPQAQQAPVVAPDDQVTITQPPIDSLGEPVDPSAGAPSAEASMGEPVDGGAGAPPTDGSMGQPADTNPLVFNEFGVAEESVAIPDTPTIPTVTATGIVKSFNETSLNLVMSNRTVYRLPADFVDPGLKNGSKVKIEWYADGANRRATSVTIIK